jgi:hypothetical protein
MSLHLTAENQMEYGPQAANSRGSLSFPHASSGNPGGIPSGPLIDHSGVKILGESHLLHPVAIFSKEYPVLNERSRVSVPLLGTVVK